MQQDSIKNSTTSLSFAMDSTIKLVGQERTEQECLLNNGGSGLAVCGRRQHAEAAIQHGSYRGSCSRARLLDVGLQNSGPAGRGARGAADTAGAVAPLLPPGALLLLCLGDNREQVHLSVCDCTQPTLKRQGYQLVHNGKSPRGRFLVNRLLQLYNKAPCM